MLEKVRFLDKSIFHINFNVYLIVLIKKIPSDIDDEQINLIFSKSKYGDKFEILDIKKVEEDDKNYCSFIIEFDKQEGNF